MEEIRQVADRRGRCNLLIFGLGNDAPFWRDANPRGTTVFLEDSQEWIDKMARQHGKSLTVHKVEYTTKMKRDMTHNFKDPARWPSLRLRLPAAL